MGIVELMQKIDWGLLRKQKEYYLDAAENNAEGRHVHDGIIHLMDALQDAAVEDRFASLEEVFGASAPEIDDSLPQKDVP